MRDRPRATLSGSRSRKCSTACHWNSREGGAAAPDQLPRRCCTRAPVRPRRSEDRRRRSSPRNTRRNAASRMPDPMLPSLHVRHRSPVAPRQSGARAPHLRPFKASRARTHVRRRAMREFRRASDEFRFDVETNLRSTKTPSPRTADDGPTHRRAGPPRRRCRPTSRGPHGDRAADHTRPVSTRALLRAAGLPPLSTVRLRVGAPHFRKVKRLEFAD